MRPESLKQWYLRHGKAHQELIQIVFIHDARTLTAMAIRIAQAGQQRVDIVVGAGLRSLMTGVFIVVPLTALILASFELVLSMVFATLVNVLRSKNKYDMNKLPNMTHTLVRQSYWRVQKVAIRLGIKIKLSKQLIPVISRMSESKLRTRSSSGFLEIRKC